jgi:uncharacterized UPF0146 family protein
MIKLFSYAGGSNMIRKVKQEVVSYPLTIRRNVDIINPTIPIESSLDLIALDVNYCYIEDLHRYYFIDIIVPYPNNIYRLSCRVDVLETYKDDILNAKSHIVSGTKLGYSNQSVTTDSRRTTVSYDSDVELPETFSYVLNTLGG